MSTLPHTAMVLAAGLGTRLRPITDHTPKPLIPVAGRTLLDRCLDRLVEAGVKRAVVNVHWLGSKIVDHLRNRRDIDIVISDESDQLLETGGGIARALPLLGDAPFFSVNADLIWRDTGGKTALQRLAETFDPTHMDGLLLLQPRERADGHDGPGDFFLTESGRLVRRGDKTTAPYVYTGVQMLRAHLFSDIPGGAFSLNILYDRAIAAGRLYGLVHHGRWMDVGTHEGLKQAEMALHGDAG